MRKRFSEQWTLHAMLLPSLILLLLFSYVPMFGIVIAFQKYSPAKGILNSEWVGLDNFRYAFMLPSFPTVIRNSFWIAGMKIVCHLIVQVVFALLLNEIRNIRFKRTVQTIVYMPHFLSWVILGGVFVSILSPTDGIVNRFIQWMGGESIFFLGKPSIFPYTVLVTDLWKEMGFGAVIFLAALTGIDPTYYEAAIVDGANRWQQTWHITLPGLLPTIVLVFTLSLGNVLSGGFDQILNLYSISVYSTGDIIDTFVYRLGLQDFQFSVSTAVGLFKSLVSSTMIVVSYWLAHRFAGYRII